jgi:hypothetical protein
MEGFPILLHCIDNGVTDIPQKKNESSGLEISSVCLCLTRKNTDAGDYGDTSQCAKA